MKITRAQYLRYATEEGMTKQFAEKAWAARPSPFTWSEAEIRDGVRYYLKHWKRGRQCGGHKWVTSPVGRTTCDWCGVIGKRKNTTATAGRRQK